MGIRIPYFLKLHLNHNSVPSSSPFFRSSKSIAVFVLSPLFWAVYFTFVPRRTKTLGSVGTNHLPLFSMPISYSSCFSWLPQSKSYLGVLRRSPAWITVSTASSLVAPQIFVTLHSLDSSPLSLIPTSSSSGLFDFPPSWKLYKDVDNLAVMH